MPNLNIDELERLHAAATPGPWACDVTGVFRWRFLLEKEYVCEVLKENNSAYIVAACNSLPTLIAENRALQEKVRELERQRKELSGWNYEFQREARKLQFQLEQAAKEAGE